MGQPPYIGGADKSLKNGAAQLLGLRPRPFGAIVAMLRCSAQQSCLLPERSVGTPDESRRDSRCERSQYMIRTFEAYRLD